MPLFDLSGGAPRRLRPLRPAAETHERQVCELLWDDLEGFTGEPLFPVARRPALGGGGAPDILALDTVGRVVLIEIARLVDRDRLATCLDLLGWAERTDAGELADLYGPGSSRFADDWRVFASTGADAETGADVAPGPGAPAQVGSPARLVLAAFAVEPRSEATLTVLASHGVPLVRVPVQLYETPGGDRILDIGRVGGDDEGDRARPTLADLVEAGTLQTDEPLVWRRRQLSQEHTATVTARGEVRLSDGRVVASPSTACNRLGSGSYNGWECWVVPRLGDARLSSLVPAS